MASTWTTDDDQYFIWNGEVRIPKTFDPAAQAAVVMLGPTGGVAQIPALAKGDPGQSAEIDPTIVFNALEYDDPTADSAEFVQTVAGSDSTAPVYQLHLNLHKGAPGTTSSSAVLTASDVTGTAVDGYTLAKTAGASTVSWVAPRVGGQYWPASIANTGGADGSNRTLCSVQVAAQPFPWRPRVHGQCVISGTANTRVDIIARLNNATSGDIVGRSYGLAGATPPPNILVSGVPAGSASSVGLVAAGAAATIFLRAELQSSTTDAYTTASSTTSFMVEIAPVSPLA